MSGSILFLDDQESQRVSLSFDLRDLFGVEFSVSALPLFSEMADYVPELEKPDVCGVFIDQKLNETGEITEFNGVILCEHLRAIFPSLPIYLVTAQVLDDDLTSSRVGAAEQVVQKRDLRANSDESKCLKQRFMRHASRHKESLQVEQQRFRELLLKSTQSDLEEGERIEFRALQASRLVATEAAEVPQNEVLNEELEEISALIDKLEELGNSDL